MNSISDKIELELNRWVNAVNACYECGKEGTSDLKLQRCGRCKYTLYCSAACQKKHWINGHIDECKLIAKEKSKGTWSLATGTCAKLAKGHRLFRDPTPPDGIELAREVAEQNKNLPIREIYARNPLLGLWISRLYMLDREQLQLFADFLLGECMFMKMPEHLRNAPERMVLLRSIFLVGCGSCGQPTIAEIVQVKFRRHKLQTWKEMKECVFFEIDKENGGSATFLCKRSFNTPKLMSGNTSTCAMGVLAKQFDNFTDPSFMNYIKDFDPVILFSTKGKPNDPLDADAVERDLCQVLEALDIPTYPSIDAIMAATSFRVLREDQGIEQRYRTLRYYKGVRCIWPDFS